MKNKKPNAVINKLIFMLCTILAFWVIGLPLMLIFGNQEIAINIMNVFGWWFVAVTIFMVLRVVTSKSDKSKKPNTGWA